MGLSGLEPPTSRLSGVRSNRLSYKPKADLRLCSFFYAGSLLLSHAVPGIVPSAARAFTIVFGMGTCVSPGRIAASFFLVSFRKQPGPLPPSRHIPLLFTSLDTKTAAQPLLLLP